MPGLMMPLSKRGGRKGMQQVQYTVYYYEHLHAYTSYSTCPMSTVYCSEQSYDDDDELMIM